MGKLVNNLYFKNIPVEMKEEDVKNIFAPFGHIKSLVMFQNEIGQFGFVCFKQPDACAAAKTALQNQTFDGKVLIINNYEIKEIRAIQMAELKDKTDWEKYRQQQTGGFQWNDLTSQPHLTQIIQQLLQLMQQNDQMNQRQGGDRRMNNQQ